MNEVTIRALTLADVDAFVAHSARHDQESGTCGELPYGPYERSEGFDARATRERTERRWSTPLSEPGWRRAWGAVDGDVVVGHCDLAGAALKTQLHRVNLGLGLQRPYRGRGLGRALLQAALDWAREQPTIAWVDLGVFAGNDIARQLYEALGFTEIGRTADCFRVDGKVIDDISMTLQVA